MNALWYLSYKKLWGIVRGWFRKPVTAIFTVLSILVLIVMVGSLIFVPQAQNIEDFSLASLIFVVVFGIVLITVLLNENKALVFLSDARFVLSGPFSKKQVLVYILINDLAQNLVMTLMFSGYILFFFRGAIGTFYHFVVFILTMLSYLMLMMFFSSYDYILEKSKPNYRRYKKFVVFIMVLGFVGYVGYFLLQKPLNLVYIPRLFFNSKLYWYPIFGWQIGTLYYGASHQYLYFVGLLLLPLGLALLSAYLFFNTKVDFYEAALSDSEHLQGILEKQKAGDESWRVKVREKEGNFYEGAWALWSRFVLQMRKARQLLRVQDIIFFVLYTAIAYFSGSIEHYRTMLSIAVFLAINNESLIYELKRPFVYLIPEANSKKMLILTLPILYRTLIISLLGGLVSLLLFKASFVDAIQLVLSLWGIALIILGAGVFSLRLLRGNQNPFISLLIRMFVIIVSFIPVILIMIIVTFFVVPIDDPRWMTVLNMVMGFTNSGMYFLLVWLASKILDGNDMFV